MTKTEMEDAIRNCTNQLSALREILPSLATKTDLEQFATKKDLERFATKTDLERFATKADLERFATKADLERYATKGDLVDGIADAKQHTRVLFESLEDRIRAVADGYFALNDKMDGVTQRLDRLADRLEKKGVI